MVAKWYPDGMRTTIDAAGRIVIPKPIRDAMGISAGREIDVVYTDGKIEIDVAPAEVDIDTSGPVPVVRPRQPMPPLTDDVVRETLEAVRR